MANPPTTTNPATATPAPSIVGINWQGIVPYALGAAALWYLLPKPIKWAGIAGAYFLYTRHEATIAQTASAVVDTITQRAQQATAKLRVEENLLDEVQQEDSAFNSEAA